MEIFKLQIGDIVESTQGRDLGCRYVVIDINKKGYCSLINGKLRTMDKPKIKNPIHLSYVGSYPELIVRLKSPITNHELNKLIEKFNAMEE
ncbi:MAG: RNA-binding protein [Clostridia bacterium]|nr:RNA-binding protein [Clostridia bacterium]